MLASKNKHACLIALVYSLRQYSLQAQNISLYAHCPPYYTILERCKTMNDINPKKARHSFSLSIDSRYIHIHRSQACCCKSPNSDRGCCHIRLCQFGIHFQCNQCRNNRSCNIQYHACTRHCFCKGLTGIRQFHSRNCPLHNRLKSSRNDSFPPC